MADKNQLKIADQVDLADDDPFAELTRIMGFDPRQPARQAPAPVESSPAEQVEEDDFSLDLEKELLGGFDLEEEAAAPDLPVEEAQSADEPQASVAEAIEPEAPEADFDFSADFDAAMAATAEPTADVQPDVEFDLHLAEDDLRGFDAEADQAAPAEADFDLGLTDEDVQALDTEPFAAAPPAEAELTDAAPEAVHLDADLDAAMANIDMDFLGDPRVPELESAAIAEPVEAVQPEAAGDADMHFFDENDFRLEDEAATAAEPEPQPEFDEPPFSLGEDELRLDEEQPMLDQARQPEADTFSFDDVDFAADDISAPVEPETTGEPVQIAVEPEPMPAVDIPAIPLHVPRKLPTSPMDVAAEEFRQRGAADQAPAEPEFNLEDELNALLGNIRTPQTASIEATPAAEAAAEPVYETLAYTPPTFEARPAAYEPVPLPVEPVGFNAPEHPADIQDDLSWELDEAFAAETAEEPGYQPVEHQPVAYAEGDDFDAYAEAEQVEEEYAQGYHAAEEPAPIDFEDEAFGQPVENQPPAPYGGALAGAALGAAASRFDSGFASRPFETGSSWRTTGSSGAAAVNPTAPERYAQLQQEAFSPHRDPVVRGDPMKEDPLDVITQLAEKYSRKEPMTPYGRAMGVARGAGPFADPLADEDMDISAALEEQPDVETVEVADRAVAFADDLDIPELAEEEELPPVSDYDDLDAEFSSLLTEMNAEPKPMQTVRDDLAGGFDARPYQSGAAATQTARKAYDDDPEPDSFALDADDLPRSRVPEGGQYAADEYDYDPDFEQEIAPAHFAAENAKSARSRGMLLASLVGGVALVGAIGAFALSWGGGAGGDAPAIVKADDGPVKVKPENPGGTTVPNQDNKVYETVAGEGAAEAPQQEKLVTTAEEPVDVTPPPAAEETASASGKSEDRIEQILQEAAGQTDEEIAAVAPRKVRTMVVKPDGTLVPREDEPAAAAAAEQTDTVAAVSPEASAPAAPEATGALPAAAEPTPAAVKEPAAEAPLPPGTEPAPEVAAAEPEAEAATMPETAPIAPLRPADQPIDVVGEVKPDQVAAATAAAAGGNWAMQIASQPSEAAAQSSYQDLARRYGSVLEGREVNIVKAEITGKGTFWRVRVPAESRNEAISLCENYKAAGGNCFVSR